MYPNIKAYVVKRKFRLRLRDLFPAPLTDNTRNSFHKIFITLLEKNTIGSRVARYWNSPDAHIKSAKYTKAFKNYIDASNFSDHFLVIIYLSFNSNLNVL